VPVLDGRACREENSPINVADVMRLGKSSLRPLERSVISVATDSRGDKFVDRKVVATTGATSDGVERIVELKRVKFDLESGQDLSERVEEAGARTVAYQGMLAGFITAAYPVEVVTRQPTLSFRTDTLCSENLLPPMQIQDCRFFPNRGHQEGRYEPVIDKYRRTCD